VLTLPGRRVATLICATTGPLAVALVLITITTG
jgi:hypothetical protein